MSTIASPGQSTTSLSTDHSPRRPSFETTARSQATSPARPARRNKNALRDYYGLKAAAAPADATSSNGPQREAAEPALEIARGEFDTPGFDPEAYVRDTLARESLQGLLKIESGLINDIRALDGEKKALVYDNYSKLITATDTIRRVCFSLFFSTLDMSHFLSSENWGTGNMLMTLLRLDEDEYGSADTDDFDVDACDSAYCRDGRVVGGVVAGSECKRLCGGRTRR